jgi:hypothetical protein
LDRAQPELPIFPCAYLVRNTRSPCKTKISKKNGGSAKLQFADLFGVLNDYSGVPDKIRLFDVLNGLPKTILCTRHAVDADQAAEQWFEELGSTAPRLSLLSKLRRFYEEDEGEDEGEEEEEAEDEGEVSVLSTQSSSTQFISRQADVPEDKVAQKVTSMLERTLLPTENQPGHIYIFSSNTPGMLKIGYSKNAPEIQRLKAHKSCYQEIDLIMSKCVPYAYRVEQLVLAELSSVHCKLATKCTKCDKFHREWLQIDQETLLKIVNKWIEFVKTHPYSPQGKLRREAVLPLPALSRRRRRPSSNATPTKKGKGKSSQTPPPDPRLKAPEVTAMGLDSDGSASDPEDCASASHKRYQDSIASVSAQFCRLDIAFK